jgi:hypothetical protein
VAVVATITGDGFAALQAEELHHNMQQGRDVRDKGRRREIGGLFVRCRTYIAPLVLVSSVNDEPSRHLVVAGRFWCFREEFHPDMLRDENYRVVKPVSEEWVTLSGTHPAIKPPPNGSSVSRKDSISRQK